MIIKDLDGIVFNSISYKDNDLIVDVYTHEYGFIQLYVKGAQKTSSKSFYIFKMFNIIKFDLSKIDLDNLSIYRSGSIVEVFDYTKIDYDMMNVVSFISECLIRIKELKDFDQKKYYASLIKAVADLKSKNSYLDVVNYFLLNTLDVLGAQIVLDRCCYCNQTTQIEAYDLEMNGFVCHNCIGSSRVIKDEMFLKYLYNLNKNSIGGILVEQSLKMRVFKLLYSIMYDNVGIQLRSYKYLIGDE